MAVAVKKRRDLSNHGMYIWICPEMGHIHKLAISRSSRKIIHIRNPNSLLPVIENHSMRKYVRFGSL
jgi:hypothetical protein